ncbi:MAG: MurR/RpiR family transcriptional regulator [Aeromonas sp.]
MSILSQLAALSGQLSPSEQKIADFVLANGERIAQLSSPELAQAVAVSQSSIVKFTQKLGYKGFPAFKLVLSQAIGRQQERASPASGALYQDISFDDSLATMAAKLLLAQRSALADTLHAVDWTQFASVLDAMVQAPRLQIAGLGGSLLSALDLWHKLLKIGLPAVLAQDSHVQISIAQTLGHGDVLLLLSYSGQSKEMRQAAQLAKNNGALVVLITSYRPSPLRQLADSVLTSVASEETGRISAMVSRSAQQALTDMLFLGLMQRKGAAAWPLIKGMQHVVERLNR